jgi:ABC-type multidrug transport system permease subunit
MQLLSKSFRIFLVLVQHDIKLLSATLKSALLDSIAPLVTQTITFGYLFALLGMPKSMVAPIYLGSLLALFMQLGYSLAMRTGFDLTYNRFVDYHITLPVSKRWLFAAYMVNNMLEVLLISLPLISIGIAILHSQFDFSHANWIGVVIMYALTLAFFSSLFLALAYTAQLKWIMDNAWPRLLVPLWLFSSGLVIWKNTYAWNPSVAYVMLLSPFTYIAEGLRASMLGNENFIPWPYCALMLIIFIAINLFVLSLGIKKRLDPV